MTSDICIIGGGPAGLAAALALTRSGREVTVLDCAEPPIDKACGEGLMPDSLAALSHLGVNVSHFGTAIHGIRFFGAGSSVSADFPNGVGRGMRRPVLHEHMVKQVSAAGIRMLWGVRNIHCRPGYVSFNGGHIRTQLIVGADGLQSTVREQAGLNHPVWERRRFGFRRHYTVEPWSPYVEIYWGHHFQIYVTPVGPKLVCVALLSRDPHLRLDAALAESPLLAGKLAGASLATPERGSLSLSRRFWRITSDGFVLLGDASGSVDSITGEGMCLAFKQAVALVTALDAKDLRLYERAHRQIGAAPLRMAALMLFLDTNPILQGKALASLAANPRSFSSLLAAHVSNKPLTEVISWNLLSFGFGVLRA